MSDQLLLTLTFSFYKPCASLGFQFPGYPQLSSYFSQTQTYSLEVYTSINYFIPSCSTTEPSQLYPEIHTVTINYIHLSFIL